MTLTPSQVQRLLPESRCSAGERRLVHGRRAQVSAGHRAADRRLSPQRSRDERFPRQAQGRREDRPPRQSGSGKGRHADRRAARRGLGPERADGDGALCVRRQGRAGTLSDRAATRRPLGARTGRPAGLRRQRARAGLQWFRRQLPVARQARQAVERDGAGQARRPRPDHRRLLRHQEQEARVEVGGHKLRQYLHPGRSQRDDRQDHPRRRLGHRAHHDHRAGPVPRRHAAVPVGHLGGGVRRPRRRTRACWRAGTAWTPQPAL